MDFVFLSLQRIDADRESTSTSLARELARQGHNVLYVNSPLDRKDFFSKSKATHIEAHLHSIKLSKPLQQINSGLWSLNPTQFIESFNWVPFTYLFTKLIKINNRRLAHDIKLALAELGFKDYILVNDKDIFRSFYLKEFLRPYKYVYLDRDYTLGIEYWRRHGTVLEPILMRKSDAVFCNSLDFTKNAKRYNPNSFYIGNGFDVKQFDHTHIVNTPEDLISIPNPRIGYVGALINIRLDLDLLIKVVKARPAWSFVLVGKEDKAFMQSELHELPNVHFLGIKHTKEISSYIQHFDVCINPQILNEITKSNFPLKVLEYLAMGKPVVATTTNTMTEVFSQYTYLAQDEAEYVMQLEKALIEDSPQQAQNRIEFVKMFSWEEVVKLFVSHLHKLGN
jgi:teichuronic acid biosynthesis glycosyltransferase TuaH